MVALTLIQLLVGASRSRAESAVGDVFLKGRDCVTTSSAERLERCLGQREPSAVSDAECRPGGSDVRPPVVARVGARRGTRDMHWTGRPQTTTTTMF